MDPPLERRPFRAVGAPERVNVAGEERREHRGHGSGGDLAGGRNEDPDGGRGLDQAGRGDPFLT